MAEIEHFVDPNDKSHPKFNDIKDVEMVFYSADDQMSGQPAKKCKIGRAVDQVNN
jgi:glycyl-tRNA synthetase